jgi:T-complex protein 1 subunit theta
MQEQEVGDGTNFVIIMAGALLEQAEHLLKMVGTYNIEHTSVFTYHYC